MKKSSAYLRRKRKEKKVLSPFVSYERKRLEEWSWKTKTTTFVSRFRIFGTKTEQYFPETINRHYVSRQPSCLKSWTLRCSFGMNTEIIDIQREERKETEENILFSPYFSCVRNCFHVLFIKGRKYFRFQVDLGIMPAYLFYFH